MITEEKEFTKSPDLQIKNVIPFPKREYDFLLKFLLVGDSDVGKQEIISKMDDGSSESPFCCDTAYKTTVILLDGHRIKLQIWDTSGQGRFCTILRSYSRGAQGIILVYDITNRWSFQGLNRWLHEIEENAPGIPKILIGNRLHLAFQRQVSQIVAENYAKKNLMPFFEVSSLCDFNIRESFAELSRLTLKRNRIEHLLYVQEVTRLKELCCKEIVSCINPYNIDYLPIPQTLKFYLKSYVNTWWPVYKYIQSNIHKRKLQQRQKKIIAFLQKSCAIS